MSGASADRSLRLKVDALNDQYDPDDERWLDQAGSLYRELCAEADVADVVPGEQAVPGAKGTVDQLIIALGSAGAFQAAVECFRAWLGRDRDRRINLTWDDAGVMRSVTLTGGAADTAALKDLAVLAAKQAGDQPWPAGTEPS